jgi:hypothetical protein
VPQNNSNNGGVFDGFGTFRRGFELDGRNYTRTQFNTQSPTGTSTPSSIQTRTASKPLSGTRADTGALAKQANKPFAAAATPLAAIVKLVSKSVLAALTPPGSLVKFITKPLSGTRTDIGMLVKQANKPFTATATPSAAIATMRTIGKLLSAALIITAQIRKLTALPTRGGALTGTGVIQKLALFVKSGTIVGFQGNLAKLAKLVEAGGLTPNASIALARMYGLLLSGAMALTASIAKGAQLMKTGALTPSALIVTFRTITKSFTGAMTLAASVVKVALLSKGATRNDTATITKATSTQQSAAVTPHGIVNKLAQLVKSGSGLLQGALTKLTAKAISGFLSFVGSIATFASGAGNHYSLALAASLLPSGAIQNYVMKVSTGLVLASSRLAKFCAAHQDTTFTIHGAIAKLAKVIEDGATTAHASLTRRAQLNKLGILAASSNQTHAIAAQRGGQLTEHGTLQKFTTKATFTASLILGATVITFRTIGKLLSASLTVAGTLTKLAKHVAVGTWNAAGTQQRFIDHLSHASWTALGNLARRTTKNTQGAAIAAGAIHTFRTIGLQLLRTFTATSAIARHVFIRREAQQPMHGTVNKDISTVVAANIQPLGALRKLVALSVSGALTAFKQFFQRHYRVSPFIIELSASTTIPPIPLTDSVYNLFASSGLVRHFSASRSNHDLSASTNPLRLLPASPTPKV